MCEWSFVTRLRYRNTVIKKLDKALTPTQPEAAVEKTIKQMVEESGYTPPDFTITGTSSLHREPEASEPAATAKCPHGFVHRWECQTCISQHNPLGEGPSRVSKEVSETRTLAGRPFAEPAVRERAVNAEIRAKAVDAVWEMLHKQPTYAYIGSAVDAIADYIENRAAEIGIPITDAAAPPDSPERCARCDKAFEIIEYASRGFIHDFAVNQLVKLAKEWLIDYPEPAQPPAAPPETRDAARERAIDGIASAVMAFGGEVLSYNAGSRTYEQLRKQAEILASAIIEARAAAAGGKRNE